MGGEGGTAEHNAMCVYRREVEGCHTLFQAYEALERMAANEMQYVAKKKVHIDTRLVGD